MLLMASWVRRRILKNNTLIDREPVERLKDRSYAFMELDLSGEVASEI